MKKVLYVLTLGIFIIPIMNLQALDNVDLTSNQIEELTRGYSKEEIDEIGLDKIIDNELKNIRKDAEFKDFREEMLQSIKNRKIDKKESANLANDIYSVETFKKSSVKQSLNSSAYNFDYWKDAKGNSMGHFVNPPIFEQEKRIWCGPASVKTAIHIMTGSSKPQSYYAGRLDTDNKGGSSYSDLFVLLNEAQHLNDYGWRLASKYPTYDEWMTGIYGSIISDLVNRNVPVIAQTFTPTLYMYNGRKLDHYITITGYSDLMNIVGTASMGLTYVDNFYEDYGRGTVLGEHSDLISNMRGAIVNITW